MNEPALTLREAKAMDCRFYWEVNNAPTTRALSISPEPIPWESHQAWYAARLSNPQSRLYVALIGDTSIGVIRFDLSDVEAVISVALSPEEQGKGYGRRIIAMGTEHSLETFSIQRVLAYIRPNNVGSIRAFEAAGYTHVRHDTSQGLPMELYAATQTEASRAS